MRVSFHRTGQESPDPEERRHASLRGKTLVISHEALSVIIMLPHDVLFLESVATRLDLCVEFGTYRLTFESQDECELWMALLMSQGVSSIDEGSEGPADVQAHPHTGLLHDCTEQLNHLIHTQQTTPVQ